MLDAVTENTTTANKLYGETNGRKLVVIAAGTWGSGTLTPQISPDSGTTWVSTPEAVTLTANGSKVFTVPDGCLFRLTFTGSTDPALSAWVGEVSE